MLLHMADATFSGSIYLLGITTLEQLRLILYVNCAMTYFLGH